MTRDRRSAYALLAAAGLVLATGCASDSTSCASETPQVQGVDGGTCSRMEPGATVQVRFAICPKTCQTDPSCNVDVQATYVQLDPVVHTCDPSSCSLSCDVASNITCTFTTPSAEGSYPLYVIDSNGAQLTATLEVGGSGISCDL
jgi:hypothetical protein